MQDCVAHKNISYVKLNDMTIICLFDVSRDFLRKEKAKKMLHAHIVIL